jgi:purine-binding chemotaxis protein CheW
VTREFAVFSINEAVFAFDVSDVREILRAASLSPAPGHEGVEGLLNLRGEVVPVIDVRSRLGLPAREIAVSDYLIVLESEGRRAIVRTESNVRLETMGDSAVQPATATNSLVTATIRLEKGVASLLTAADLSSGQG